MATEAVLCWGLKSGEGGVCWVESELNCIDAITICVQEGHGEGVIIFVEGALLVGWLCSQFAPLQADPNTLTWQVLFSQVASMLVYLIWQG